MADRITQVAVEVLRQPVPNARVSQVAVEVLRTMIAGGLVSQIAVEVLQDNIVTASGRTFVAGMIG